MLVDFVILYLSSSFVLNHLPSGFHMYSSVCSSLLCIRESSTVGALWRFTTQKSESMLQKPLVPTACISGDCNRTCPGSGTSGCAGFGIFERLWQTRGLENKGNSGPFHPVLSENVCAQTILYFKIHAYFYRW